MEMEIATNNKRRPLYALDELGDEEKEWFDWITGEGVYENRLFLYRGSWYDAFEFERLPEGGELATQGWDGCRAYGMFDALIVKLAVDDAGDDAVVVGYVTW